MHAWLLVSAVTHTRLLSATRLVSRAAPFQRRAYQPSMGLADMVSKLVGMGEPGAPRVGVPAGNPAPLASDTAPSWEELHGLWKEQATDYERGFRERLAAGTGDEACHLATVRVFDGTKADAERVVLYRDTAAWCPYCEKTWLALEEKRVPYTVKKINMNCYGDKPDWFWKLNPSGGIPVASIDGQVITESNEILMAIESTFTGAPYRALLPDQGDPSHPRVRPLLSLERQLFSCWFRWLTSSANEGAQRLNFISLMDSVDDELRQAGGPFFLGPELSMVDCMFAPFLERMAASLPYYKGLPVRRQAQWRHVEAWFLAMEARPSYRHIASDFYTHCHDLPPQIGRCQISGAEAQRWADRIDGADGRAWRLPLLKADDEPQPLGGFGQQDEAARREAAERVIANHRNIVRFAARAGGRPGFPPASAPLSDPRASVLEASIPQVDAALRHAVHALLDGPGGATARLSDGLEPPVVAASLGYLRDRISVPRDMGAPAARHLRANLNEVIERVGAAAAAVA